MNIDFEKIIKDLELKADHKREIEIAKLKEQEKAAYTEAEAV